MHGFTIFFAYLTYAHVLTYWYGNVPEETEYLLHRMHGPWLWIISIVPLTVFVLPLYVLIFKAAKWTPAVTIPICLIILVSQWFTNVLLVTPEVVSLEEFNMPFLLEGGLFFGFLGLFLTSYFWFGKRYPMVCIADPLLPEAYSEHH